MVRKERETKIDGKLETPSNIAVRLDGDTAYFHAQEATKSLFIQPR